MRSIVLPWYPGGHVPSKMQGRYLYLQDRHGEGSQRKNISKKSRRLQPYQRVLQENRHRRRNTRKKTTKKKQAQPTHATARSLTQRPKCQSHNLRVFDKTQQKEGTNISISKTEKREITKGQKDWPSSTQ